MLDQVKIVLVEPTHPGNIGAVARSMKTMGLSQLVLVEPKKFPHYEATKRAAGAQSVLEQASVVSCLAEALSDCILVLGTSVRDREVKWPTLAPREAADLISERLTNQNSMLEMSETMSESMFEPKSVAVLFGRESSGLTNNELELCHSQIRIPANPEYSSLNLASAVQIIAYEISLLLGKDDSACRSAVNVTSAQLRQQPATMEQKSGHLEHLLVTLNELDFIKSKNPNVLIRKLTRLYNKADLSVEEIQILRGILSAIQSKLARS